MARTMQAIFIAICYSVAAIVIKAQYYSPPNMGGAVGCVVTGTKLYSHGNFIRDINSEELIEFNKYKKDLIDFKEKVNAAYANIDDILQKNGTLPILPTRPVIPAFCASNETTLYILGGCTVQNHKVYIGGKFARELNEKEKMQLDEFAKQMVAANYAAAHAALTNNKANSTTDVPVSKPSTTTISPTNDAGRQIALDFCMEF